MPQQFENPANPEIHRKHHGRGDLEATPAASVDIFVAGVGTGGTITGVGEVLKPRKPGLKVVAVEPEASAGPVGRHARPAPDPGHRRRLRPRHPEPRGDRRGHHRSATTTAFRWPATMAALEGIPVGISSGAAVAAALEVGARKGTRASASSSIIPDFAERYLSTALFEGLD